MKENQKKLYDHFVKISKERNGIVAKNAARYAEEILKSFPEFKEERKK